MGLCAGVIEARADMVSDSLAPRAVGVGGALTAAAYGSVAKTLNPAGVGLTKAYVIEGAYGFRPEDDGKIASVSICDSTRRTSVCLSYDYLSSAPTEDSERTLHLVSLAASYPFGDRILFGITTRYLHYTENVAEPTPEDHSREGEFTSDAGLVIKLGSMLNLAVVGHNLLGADEDQFPRAFGGGLALFATPSLMFAADARYATELEAARASAGAEYFFSASDGAQGFPIRAGYIYDELADAHYVTGGLGYMTQKLALDVGARKQVSGDGDELTIQFGLRLFLPNH
jgi:hypothetical protein